MVVISLLSSMLVSMDTTNCDGQWAAAGLCGSTDGSSLTISGTQQRSGTPAVPNTPGMPGTRDASTPGSPTEPAPPSDRAIRLADCMDDSGTVRCHEPTRPGESSPIRDNGAPAAPSTPTITITDLAQFAPPPLTASADPGNVGIAGLPTNFIAAADVHTQTGELFGVALSVRFSPITYLYDYGDRSTSSTAVPGRTWQELGQAQFTPTPTTHVYKVRGNYLARVDVAYTAEVDFGTGWIPLPGEITTIGAPQEIRILEAHTALVAQTCTEDPHGIGC
jgi:hypothetical protein